MKRERPLRLAIVGSHGIPARHGGFETFAERLAYGLVEHGHRVTVYCDASRFPQAPDRPAAINGVDLVHVKVPVLGALHPILYDLASIWHARKGHDVVYILGYNVAFFCGLPRLWGTRVWLNPGGLEWARAKWPAYVRFYLRRSEWWGGISVNMIVADAEAMADHMRKRLDHRVPVRTIPYGTDIVSQPPPLDPLDRWGVSPESYFLIVCRFVPENHVKELIEGFIASGSERSLLVVGDVDTKTRYVRGLTQFRDPRVRFLGRVYERDGLPTLRYHALAYGHGHSMGGTNPSLLEALGCGNPVIAHDNVFNREVAGKAALYFSTVEQVTNRFNRLDRDPDLRGELKAEAFHRARAAYSWDLILARYQELLDEEASRRNAGRHRGGS